MVNITGDVVYDYDLVSCAGAAFTLYREPRHSDSDIEAATAFIKMDRDVVGRIKVISLASIMPTTKPRSRCWRSSQAR